MSISRSRGAATRQRRPGPHYDTVMRRTMQTDPAAACKLIGVPVSGAPTVLSTSFPSATLEPDLVLEVGPDRLAHVEYVRAATRDLVARMLVYRGLIMRDHPGAVLTQHVIVLGDGFVNGHNQLQRNNFALILGLVYLRDLNPAELLTDPTTAPLAVLARGDPDTRRESLARAYEVIRSQGAERTSELLEFATTMAIIRLEGVVITDIVEETNVSDPIVQEILFNSRWGRRARELARAQGLETGMAQGLETGLTRGLEKGRNEARLDLLIALLRERFDGQPGLMDAARRLAAWPDSRQAVHAVATAATLSDLPDLPGQPEERDQPAG